MPLIRDMVEDLLQLEDEELDWNHVLDELQTLVTMAADFAAAKVPDNALSVIELLTDPLVNACVRPGVPEENVSDVEAFFGNLESVWQEVLNAKQLTSSQAEEWFAKLGTWRNSLSKVLGPIFSDALRLLKKRIQSTASSSSSSQPSATLCSSDMKQEEESANHPSSEQSNKAGKNEKAITASASRNQTGKKTKELNVSKKQKIKGK